MQEREGATLSLWWIAAAVCRLSIRQSFHSSLLRPTAESVPQGRREKEGERERDISGWGEGKEGEEEGDIQQYTRRRRIGGAGLDCYDHSAFPGD